ncbi:MAG: hypothetical protein V2A54_10760 [Bacteroidota bacterium]
MKTFLFAILFLIAGSLTAQDTAKLITSIDQSVKKTDQLKFTNAVNLRNEEVWENVPDGGTELNGLFYGDTLVKIAFMCGLSYGVITEEYSFKNGKLIFVIEKESDYVYDEKKQSLDYTRLEPVFEEKFYFVNEKLLKRIPKGKKKFNDELYYDSQTREGVLISAKEKYVKLIMDKINKR